MMKKIYKDGNGGTFKKVSEIKGVKQKIITTSPTKENNHFVGWSADEKAENPYHFENGEYEGTEQDVALYPLWISQANGTKEEFENDSLLGKVSKINESNTQTTITVNQESYTANVIVKNEDLVLDGETQIDETTLENNVYEIGNKETDVATENEYAKNMVILKVNGNLTINYNVTVTACKSDSGYGGPKGLLIYCTGKLTNNGTIDMTARGAKAVGQNVYLWKNAEFDEESDDVNSNYEYIPAEGGNGGTKVWAGTGRSGENGQHRQTGGGGAGRRLQL